LIGVATDVTERKQAEAQIKQHLSELEAFNRVAVGRELRMVELKQEINELCIAAGQPPRYNLDFAK
jgi:hypothetical protein